MGAAGVAADAAPRRIGRSWWIVLLQAKGQGLGNIFGGGGETYLTRRGVERVLFRTTIALITAFVALSIAAVRAA